MSSGRSLPAAPRPNGAPRDRHSAQRTKCAVRAQEEVQVHAASCGCETPVGCGKSASGAASRHYRARNAPPGRCAGARAPAVRAGLPRGDAPPDGRPGGRRRRARRQRGRRRGGQVAARAPARLPQRRRRLAVLRPDRRRGRRALVHRAPPRGGRPPGRPVVVDWRAGWRRPSTGRRSPIRSACTCAAGSCSAAASSATCSRRTSTIPTRSPARAACPIRCSPSSAARAPARCATSSRRSRASRTRSSARRSRRAWSCRAVRAPARPRSGCTAPRSCSTSTAPAGARWRARGRSEPGVPALHQPGAPVARRDVGDADDGRRPARAPVPHRGRRLPCGGGGQGRRAHDHRDRAGRRRRDPDPGRRHRAHVSRASDPRERGRAGGDGGRRSLARRAGHRAARAIPARARASRVRRLHAGSRSGSTSRSSVPSFSPTRRRARRSTGAGDRSARSRSCARS